MRTIFVSALLVSVSSVALGQTNESSESTYSDYHAVRPESSEYFAFEFGVGQYRPDVGNSAFDTVFGDDFGPALRLELDVVPVRIPYLGRVGVALGAGWSKHSAGACTTITCSQRADENITMRIYPLNVMGVLRVDVLAREFNIPLLLTAKFGLDAVVYDINTGSRDEARNVSFGVRWAVQAALELDFIAPRRAAGLDDEWGINHSFIFGEIFGSNAGSKLNIGTNLSFTAGLGLSF
ncbi:MAG: MXAN_2562 family outer membrane beta-barrel protein [Myxococcota bacterium]